MLEGSERGEWEGRKGGRSAREGGKESSDGREVSFELFLLLLPLSEDVDRAITHVVDFPLCGITETDSLFSLVGLWLRRTQADSLLESVRFREVQTSREARLSS